MGGFPLQHFKSSSLHPLPYLVSALAMTQTTSPQNHFLQQTTSVCDLGSMPTSGSSSTMGTTGRKTFKTDKKRKEAIWPDYLERWLIQAIKEYAPPPSRSSRGRAPFARFPRRNKFISEFILEHSGKKRTAKQVGSRIQQLRQTCRDSDIRELLTDLGRLKKPGDSASYDESSSSPEPELMLEMRSSASSSRSSTVTYDPPSPISSPLAPNHVPISHRIALQVILCDNDWTHRAPQLSHLYFQLLSDPVRAVEVVQDEPYASYTVPNAHLLESPTFSIFSDRLRFSEKHNSDFAVYDEGNALLLNETFPMGSERADQFFAMVPQRIWTFLVGNPHSSFYLVQTVRGYDMDPVIVVKYNITFTDSRSSLPASPIQSYDSVPVEPTGFQFNMQSTALFQPELPMVPPEQSCTMPSDAMTYGETSWAPCPSSSTMTCSPDYAPNDLHYRSI